MAVDLGVYEWPGVGSGGAAGVDSLNGLTGALTLSPGAGISITSVGSTITITNTATALTFADSIVNAAGTVTLVNDNPAPGNNMYYGTDGTGVLGWLTNTALGGTPLTFAGYDSTGTLASIANWTYADPTNTFLGEGFNWSPGIDIQNSGYTLNNMAAQLNPTANATFSFTTVFSPSANLNGGAFNIGGISLIDSYSPISGSGNIQTLRVLNSTFDLVGTNVVDTYIGINPYLHVHSGATVGVLNANNPVLYNGAIDVDTGGFLPNGLQLIALGGTIDVLPGNGSTLVNLFPNFNNGTPSLTSYQSNVTVDSTVSGSIIGYSNSNQLLGTLTANNYTGFQENTDFQSGSTVQFVNIFESNPQIHTNNIQDLTGVQISPSGGGIIQNQLYGLDVNLTQVSLNSTTDYPRAINVNGGLITANMALNIMDGLGVFNANNFVTQVGIAPGSPITTTDWINFNNAMLLYAQDDFTSSIGLGITSALYGGQVAVVSGKTIDLLSGGLIGASVPAQSTGGTVTTLSGMRYLGLFSAGGSLAITNQIGFYADAAFAGDGFSSNFWAFRSDFTTGYNFLGSNLAIGTTSKQVASGTTGLEIHTKDIFLDTGKYIGQILQLNGATSGSLTQIVPATVTPYTMTWPAAVATGPQFLQSDNAGVLSWVNGTAGGVTTVGTYDSQAVDPNGAVISGSNIFFQSADASNPGMINTIAQTFTGAKTFATYVASLSLHLNGSVSGILLHNAASTTTNYALTWPAAVAGTTGFALTSDTSGVLSWSAVGSANSITDLTGDGTASGPGSAAFTLATVNANVGTFGSSTSIPTFTVNAKGLITAASGNVVIAPAGTLTGTTLNSTVVTSSLTSVGTITTGVWNGTAINETHGGTNQTSYATGDILYASAANTLAKLPASTDGFVLTQASGIPSWAAPSAGGVTSLTAPGSTGAPNSNAATITGTVLELEYFDATNPGIATASGGSVTDVLRGDNTWGPAPAGTPTFSGVKRYASANITGFSAQGALVPFNTSAATAGSDVSYSAGTWTLNTAGWYAFSPYVRVQGVTGTVVGFDTLDLQIINLAGTTDSPNIGIPMVFTGTVGTSCPNNGFLDGYVLIKASAGAQVAVVMNGGSSLTNVTISGGIDQTYVTVQFIGA